MGVQLWGNMSGDMAVAVALQATLCFSILGIYETLMECHDACPLALGWRYASLYFVFAGGIARWVVFVLHSSTVDSPRRFWIRSVPPGGHHAQRHAPHVIKNRIWHYYNGLLMGMVAALGMLLVDTRAMVGGEAVAAADSGNITASPHVRTQLVGLWALLGGGGGGSGGLLCSDVHRVYRALLLGALVALVALHAFEVYTFRRDFYHENALILQEENSLPPPTGPHMKYEDA
jgi:hypothetical protein